MAYRLVGANILNNGKPMAIEEVVVRLNHLDNQVGTYRVMAGLKRVKPDQVKNPWQGGDDAKP